MKYYTVRTNDTIFTLAALFYYNRELWPLLYYTNVNLIGDDAMVLIPGTTLEVPIPSTTEKLHVAVSGDTSISLAKLYYGIEYYYRLIEEANDWPAELTVGNSYKIPALVSQIELDAASELRKELHVEFDK